ncbi:hypothetical protein BS78_01G182900 [Paspalum vaginatum]|nr:hypothetical protein BS78_01G182900 [Paspalum vaginatum]
MEVLALNGVMDALAEKLKALLGREYALQAGVCDGIDFLQSELKGMRAFLQDCAGCQSTTALAKHRAMEVQELVYDVEDAVDYFTHRVGPYPAGIPDMVKHFVSTLMARRQITQQVRRLRDRALEVSKWYDPSLQLPVPGRFELLPETTELQMVGIDGPRDEVIAKLTAAGPEYGSGHRRVASMVGFAGVGKTTLAMAVYRSLEDRFQCRAFVTVSRRFDIRRVLQDILQQVMISTGNSSTPEPSIATWELMGKLRDNLKDKRYLIVIDDLWEKSAWEDISRAFPENTLDSVIITTTRNKAVANACCPRYRPGHFVYEVASLNDLDSRTLFFGRIFGFDNDYPHELEEVSAKILKKCAGLPLAIVCISSLLATAGPEPEPTKWEKVYNSLGSEIENNNGLYRLKQALKVGYDDLPPHLKICLLYLSAFPEDCKIGRDRLTRRWVAEGFVDGTPNRSMQEVAEKYFSELIERSMVQAVDVDCFGEIHACRIHDVIFDLITMRSFEENFVTLIGDHGAGVTSAKRHNVRRLSLGCGTATDGLDWSGLNMSHVRSLTVYGNIDNLESVPLCRFLRILDFECCEGLNSSQLKNIGELILLKYLSFKSTWISELPPQIGELRCLETLDLTQTNIRELPVEVTRLQRLINLLAGSAELPQGIGNMISLQILCIRASSKRSKEVTFKKKRSKEAVNELLRLTNLRKLMMTYVESKSQGASLDTLPSIIRELGNRKLQSLHLNLEGYSIGLFLQILDSNLLITTPPDRLQSLRITGEHGFEKVPTWIGSLSHLTDLELTVRMMYEQDLEILSKDYLGLSDFDSP